MVINIGIYLLTRR